MFLHFSPVLPIRLPSSKGHLVQLVADDRWVKIWSKGVRALRSWVQKTTFHREISMDAIFFWVNELTDEVEKFLVPPNLKSSSILPHSLSRMATQSELLAKFLSTLTLSRVSPRSRPCLSPCSISLRPLPGSRPSRGTPWQICTFTFTLTYSPFAHAHTYAHTALTPVTHK